MTREGTPEPAETGFPSSSWWSRNAAFVFIVVIQIIGLALVLVDRWRRGTFLIGMSAMIAGILRLTLDLDGSLLAVRSRKGDGLFLIITGGLVVFLTATISSLGSE